MADGKQSEEKEKYCESESESCQPRKVNTPVEITFQEFTRKTSKSYG